MINGNASTHTRYHVMRDANYKLVQEEYEGDA